MGAPDTIAMVTRLAAAAHQSTGAGAHQSTGATTVSAGSLLVQLVIGLGVVIAAIKGAQWFVAGRAGRGRRGPAAPRRQPQLSVVARQTLGKGVHVAVVRAGDEALLLGVTAQQVTRLGRVDPAVLAESGTGTGRLQLLSGGKGAPSARTPGSPPASTWRSAIEQVRERTVRRA